MKSMFPEQPERGSEVTQKTRESQCQTSALYITFLQCVCVWTSFGESIRSKWPWHTHQQTKHFHWIDHTNRSMVLYKSHPYNMKDNQKTYRLSTRGCMLVPPLD